MKTINFSDIERNQIIEILDYFETFNSAEAVILNEYEQEDLKNLLINFITSNKLLTLIDC